jgi:hypothetical protein
MIYVEAPERTFPATKKSIFLAGSITGAKNWQKEVVRAIKDFDVVVFNPRRENFPIHDPSAALEQITWEYEMLRKADMIQMWFDGNTMSPICLFELGAWMMTSKPMVIGMDPNYQRRQDVEIQTKLVRPEIPIVYAMDDFTNVVSDMINQILLV